jgi:hypothetical protein
MIRSLSGVGHDGAKGGERATGGLDGKGIAAGIKRAALHRTMRVAA